MKERKSNRARSEATRKVLLTAARQLFIEKGYAATSTPEVVANAGVTRGALYHHFADKRALLVAVLEGELDAVSHAIEAGAEASDKIVDALLNGARAYLDAMQVPGRVRLLLVEGPVVLSRVEIDAIEGSRDRAMLRRGLAAAVSSGEMLPLPLAALEHLMSAAFDRAAQAIDAGVARTDVLEALDALILGLRRSE